MTPHTPPTLVARFWRLADRAVAVLDALRPAAQLLARWYVAGVFFRSGLTKLRDWDITLALFTDEYHVPLLSPTVAAWLGTSAELALPVLLVFGLGGRFAAAGLTILNIVAVISVPEMPTAAFQQHVFWGSLLAALLLWGPGTWSADGFLVPWLRRRVLGAGAENLSHPICPARAYAAALMPIAHSPFRQTFFSLCCATLLLAGWPAFAAGNLLQPFAAAPGEPAAPWRLALLPRQTKPVTQFKVVDIDGRRALRVEASSSYGNLVHPLADGATAAKLSWRWKVELLNDQADLQTRSGDDTTLKVCALWDEPLDNVPFGERQVLRLARLSAGEPLPAATICYVWDAKLPDGTELDSPFTHRLRYIVLRHGVAAGGGGAGWVREQRDVAADFKRLFGRETPQLPPLVGVAIGADADNTHAHSIGYVADLSLAP